LAAEMGAVSVWYVGLWYHLFVLPGKEDKAAEGTSKDILAIGNSSMTSLVSGRRPKLQEHTMKDKERNLARTEDTVLMR